MKRVSTTIGTFQQQHKKSSFPSALRQQRTPPKEILRGPMKHDSTFHILKGCCVPNWWAGPSLQSPKRRWCQGSPDAGEAAEPRTRSRCFPSVGQILCLTSGNVMHLAFQLRLHASRLHKTFSQKERQKQSLQSRFTIHCHITKKRCHETELLSRQK